MYQRILRDDFISGIYLIFSMFELREATKTKAAKCVLIEEYLAAVEAEQTPGHLAVSLGLTLAAAGWSKEDSIAAFLYQTATGFVAAAMKLLPIGQREGQRLLENWLEVIEPISLKAAHQRVLQSWSPIQDIYSMRHNRLESRLFRS